MTKDEFIKLRDLIDEINSSNEEILVDEDGHGYEKRNKMRLRIGHDDYEDDDSCIATRIIYSNDIAVIWFDEETGIWI